MGAVKRCITTSLSCQQGAPPGTVDEAIQWALRAPSGFGKDDILDVRQLTGSADLPPEILQLITESAPTWSASAWQSPIGNDSQAKGVC